MLCIKQCLESCCFIWGRYEARGQVRAEWPWCPVHEENAVERAEHNGPVKGNPTPSSGI